MLVKTIKKKTKCCVGNCEERSGKSNSTISRYEFSIIQKRYIGFITCLLSKKIYHWWKWLLRFITLLRVATTILHYGTASYKKLLQRCVMMVFMWFGFCICTSLQTAKFAAGWIAVNDPVSIENGNNNDYYSYYYNDCHSNYYDACLICVDSGL